MLSLHLGLSCLGFAMSSVCLSRVGCGTKFHLIDKWSVIIRSGDPLLPFCQYVMFECPYVSLHVHYKSYCQFFCESPILLAPMIFLNRKRKKFYILLLILKKCTPYP